MNLYQRLEDYGWKCVYAGTKFQRWEKKGWQAVVPDTITLEPSYSKIEPSPDSFDTLFMSEAIYNGLSRVYDSMKRHEWSKLKKADAKYIERLESNILRLVSALYQAHEAYVKRTLKGGDDNG